MTSVLCSLLIKVKATEALY